MKIAENSKGITLIALVITIIVLLIIAGVSIAMLTGENGLLTKANIASTETKQQGAIEKVKLAVAESYDNSGKFSQDLLKDNLAKVEGIDTNTINKPFSLPTNVRVDGIEVSIDENRKTELSNGNNNPVSVNTEYTDKNNDIAIIPKGFKVSSKEDEQTIDEGLVIIAPDGSEFVWVPVDKNTLCANSIDGKEIAKVTSGTDKNGRTNYEGKLYNFSDTTSTELTDYGQSTTSYREPALLSSYDTDTINYNTIGITEESLQEEYNEIIESIKNNGGFYVGRYGSSINGSRVASKKGVLPMSAAEDISKMWYGLYKKQKDYAATIEGINLKSTMITGSQYDAILNWALQGKDKEKVAVYTNGNHGEEILKTGSSLYPNDKINNIRDLEGNVVEWTSEAIKTVGRVHRGGYASGRSDGKEFWTSRRGYNDPKFDFETSGTRLTLYL